MREEQPSFYATIPATVRYDKSLPPSARLLYGEITALANASGQCYASNEYFAKLYEVKEREIRRWVSALETAGHIIREFDETGTKRYITPLVQIPRIRGEKIFRGGGQKSPGGRSKMTGGEVKNDLHNNTSNITSNKKGTIVPKENAPTSFSETAPLVKAESKTKRKPFVPPTLEEVAAYYKERTGDTLDERAAVFAQRFIEYYAVGDWCDKNGNPVKNWKQKILSTWDPNEWLSKHRADYKSQMKQNAAQTAPLTREEAQAKRRAELNSYTVNDLLQ